MPTKPGTYATFKTTQGTIVCELFEKDAPETVANFIGLAEGTKEWNSRIKKGAKLYDGTIFHRVIPDFMIQGGDPEGTGMGGPGYKFADETRGSKHGFQSPASSPWLTPAPTPTAASSSSPLPTPAGSPASTPSSAKSSKATTSWRRSQGQQRRHGPPQNPSHPRIRYHRALLIVPDIPKNHPIRRTKELQNHSFVRLTLSQPAPNLALVT